jgi:small-conductance mechanosensitive channel
VLQIAFNGAGWARALEHTVSWLVWLAFALWISGLLPALMNELEGVGWKVGRSTLTLRTVIEGIVTAVAVMVLTLWLSSGIESRLLRSATGGELSLRKAASNATRALLVFVGLMLALSAIGIDLTALSVVGGAIGVGIGLGLQKLAASYISGFVILTERSIRIGDYVRVDNFEGQVRHINARFTVIRSQGGQESLVPNELLLSHRVENWSLDDRRVLQTCAVVVDQAADVQQVMGLLTQVLVEQPRVLKDPAPAVLLAQVDQGGLGFTLNYWIDDLDQGQGNLKSDILSAVLLSLRSQGVALAPPPSGNPTAR